MNNLKKLIIAVLALAMVLSLCACGTNKSDETSEFTTVEAGKLHMATNAQFPPYEMVKDDGGFEGIDVEIATLIAEKLGLELVVDDMDFGSVITSVQT
ncbi:MAG: transporter substrate-binding domain-containing protein, partial [Oscillospiraceae bacterium]